MTGDDFINLARQVGMVHTPIGEIKALCRLVAAAEREACAEIAEQRSEPGTAAFIRAREMGVQS